MAGKPVTRAREAAAAAGQPLPPSAQVKALSADLLSERARGLRIAPLPLSEVPDDETCVREAKAVLLAVCRHGHAVDQVRAATALVEACAKKLPSVKEAAALSDAELSKLAEKAKETLEPAKAESKMPDDLFLPMRRGSPHDPIGVDMGVHS